MKDGTRARAAAAGMAFILLCGWATGPLAAAPDASQDRPAEAGAAPAKADPPTLKEAGREFLSDAGRIWSSPARIRGKDVLPLLGFAAAAMLLVASDEPIRDGVQTYATKHPWAGDVSSVVSQVGGLGAMGTAAAFYGAGLVLKDARARETGYLAANAIVQTFLVDNFIKHLAGRQRPFVTGEDHWAGPGAFFKSFEKGQADLYTSFHSGHAATAFSLATVVALQYRHSGWVPVVAYTLAGGVGLSRVVLDKHWASDVFVGALVGHFVGRLVVRNHERRRRLVPMVACTARGFAVSLSYDLDPAGY
jgi:membrane-associated phospholipid phosphatase